MFDTYLTIVGTVLTTPEWRRLAGVGTLVANFKVASNSRRYDKENGRWVDGDTLRVRVTCWRRLAEGVASSVMVGDPVLVTGRLYNRDWVAEDGQRRVSYEMEVTAVGHDLARGRGTFSRHRPTATTSAVEDADADARVGGQVTQPARTGPVNGRPPEPEPGPSDDDLPPFDNGEPVEFDPLDAVDILRAAGLGADATTAADGAPPAGLSDGGTSTEGATDDAEPSATGPRRRRGRVPETV